MIRPSDVLPLVQPALADFIAYLGGQPADPAASLDDLAKRYSDLKGKLGRDTVAARMGMNDNDMTAFDATLREATRRVGRLAPDAPAPENRNAMTAALRLFSWLESIGDKVEGYTFRARLPEGDDEVGRKQVRALELIIRSLITERYEDQPKLVGRLKDLLSEKVVQQWLTAADRGDVLSGTTFSELSSLFVANTEFPNYEPLYKETPLLNLLKEKRVTIRNYLDDIRRIRNVLAHNKRITPTQVALLNVYYDEIVEPLQEAHDQGRTTVNPDLYLDVSSEELNGYFSKVSEDIQGVKDSIADLRAELGGKIDEVKKDTVEIRQTTARIETGTQSANRKLWLTLGGIAAVVVIVGAVLFFVLGIGKQTTDIAKDTGDIKSNTGDIKATTNDIKTATGDIQASQARTEQAIGEIAEGFKRIDKNGGIIENATAPAEHYHNAIVYEQRGDAANARKEYLAFAEADVDAIDAYDRLARLVRVQDGRAGARELFADLAKRLKSPAIKLEYAMAFEDAERTKRIDDFLTANPDYGPGYYLLAQEYSEARTGGQSVADKQKQFDNLTKFLDADAKGTLIAHFVDQQVLGAWLDDARQTVKKLNAALQAGRTQPSFGQMRSNAGWTITFTIPEAATKIMYRVGDTGDYIETAYSSYNDQRTGKPSPITYFDMADDQGPVKIYLKYWNANGQEMGPFIFDFNPDTALVSETKGLLESTWTSWIVIQPNPGNPSQELIYFSGLMSFRCGLQKAMYSFNGAALDQELKMPPCNPKDPYAMPGDFQPYMESPAGLQKMTVQLTYTDGTQSMAHDYKPK